MDEEVFLTPRKIFQNAFNVARKSANVAVSASSASPVAQYTPKSLSRSATHNARLNLLPIIQTPPTSSRSLVNGKVINPFETQLADRLHLPVIASPSLFHRPSTPQCGGSSTQFEWTIDEVSYLGPANVEPHETQFMETPDPVLEAKAQAAISAYFKEHSIVPSPIDCPLRNQKIYLKSHESYTASSSSAVGSRTGSVKQNPKRRRDGSAQTMLTFPPLLPEELQRILASYFTFNEDQQQICENSNSSDSRTSIDHEARDASLRRKLFNFSHTSNTSNSAEDSLDPLLDRSLSPAPMTPELDKESTKNLKRSRHFCSQSDLAAEPPSDISISPVVANTANKESFGALSPISKTSSCPSSPTVSEGNKQYKACKSETSSPITHHSDQDAIYRSTPERQQRNAETGSCASRSSQCMSIDLTDCPQGTKSTDLTGDVIDEDLSYEDQLLGSSQSTCSMSQQHPTTPLRHTPRESRRNRKNLSRSFLLFSDEDRQEKEDDQVQADFMQSKSSSLSGLLSNGTEKKSSSADDVAQRKQDETITTSADATKAHCSSTAFYRTDSGFNDEETRDNVDQEEYELTDVSMQSDGAGIETEVRLPGVGKMVSTKWKLTDEQHHSGCSIRL